MATTTAKKSASQAKHLNAKEIVKGDVFSEVSHYTYEGKDGNNLKFLHHASGNSVVLTPEYVEKLLKTANQHQKEVEVGKEDKLWTASRLEEASKKGDLPTDQTKWPKVGDVMVPGIRTIWENIHSAQVFAVCFQKQDKPLSAKKLNELREQQVTKAMEKIDKAVKGKTGVAKAAAEAMKDIQENPVLPFEEGEMRTLVGYKIQFTSRDGRYDCIDMQIEEKDGNVRPVNINTLEWIIFDGVKYIVK